MAIFSAMAQQKILGSPGRTAVFVLLYHALNLSTLVQEKN